MTTRRFFTRMRETSFRTHARERESVEREKESGKREREERWKKFLMYLIPRVNILECREWMISS